MTKAEQAPMNVARPRTLRCTPAELDVIDQRASARGMTRSEFMVKCALHQARGPGEALRLSAEEQRSLRRRVEELAEAMEVLNLPHPATGMSLLEAVTYLARAWRANVDSGSSNT